MPVVHQLVAGFRRGDAISNEALLFRDMLSAHGVQSDISCPAQHIAPGETGHVRAVEKLAASVKPDDTALLHLSIGSLSNEVFRSLPCRKIILYHNITPPVFFERLSPETAAVLEHGLSEVASMVDAADEVYAVSEFNASELVKLGYKNVKVLPLVVDTKFGAARPDPVMAENLRRGGNTNIIFVGRVAPNKRHDKALLAFAAYHRCVNPKSHLTFVGGSYGSRAYKSILLGTVHTLMLRDAVTFTEFVTDEELAACYANADAFLCMSDHEGFCAPLLEAMAWRVPVFAQAAGAIPETLDGAGVLFSADTAPEAVAETMGRVLGDPALREAVLKKQDERLARYAADDPWKRLADALGLDA